MASEKENFDHSGPQDLTCVDWKNADHVRSVVACLVYGVSILERDRQEKRRGPQALAPPWWETFGFQLKRPFVDEADCSIFGATFEYKPPSSSGNHSADQPHFVVAFRGTLLKKESFARDIELDLQFILNKLHFSSPFKTAMQEVEGLVAPPGHSRVVWLAGHSLGSAIALLAGQNMAKKGSYLESFLFNPPYLPSLIEKIKNEILKLAIRLLPCVASTSGASARKSPQQLNQSADSFKALSRWVPQLFVNKADCFCSGYIGYLKNQDRMQKEGAGAIQRFASQHSLGSLSMSENGMQAEPLQHIPSAKLTINSGPLKEFMSAHRINQWWKKELSLESKVYKYNK